MNMSDERKNRDQKDQNVSEVEGEADSPTSARKDNKEESDTMGAKDES